jgi:outer membrane protein
MLRSVKVLSIVACGLLTTAPMGAALAQSKVGVVNFARLADESPQAKVVQATLEREFGQRQRELVQQQKDLKTKEEKLQRDAAVMAEAERNKAQKELLDGQRDAVRRQNEFKEDLELRRNEELGKLQRSLVLEVQNYAKAQNFDLVFTSDTVIYRKDALDITPAIVTALQAKSPPAPAAPAAPKP